MDWQDQILAKHTEQTGFFKEIETNDMAKKTFDKIDFSKLIKLVDINVIKPNPKNPRTISAKEQKKLVDSIRQDPEMLMLKPIVIDKNNVILGGNQRFDACKKLKMTEVPTIDASMLTKKQCAKFLVIDNTHSGDWDFVKMDEMYTGDQMDVWNVLAPITPDILEKKEITDDDFENEMKKYNDENAQLPITPQFHEKYCYFIVMTKNEIDAEFVRNKFDLNIKHKSGKGNKDLRLSNIITFEKLQEVCTK